MGSGRVCGRRSRGRRCLRGWLSSPAVGPIAGTVCGRGMVRGISLMLLIGYGSVEHNPLLELLQVQGPVTHHGPTCEKS
jgi:hypothetical protein